MQRRWRVHVFQKQPTLDTDRTVSPVEAQLSSFRNVTRAALLNEAVDGNAKASIFRIFFAMVD